MASRGNYRGYQGVARHTGSSPASPHVRDPRLALIDRAIPGLFKGKRVLDIGCNTGSVVVQLALYFEAASVKGVDVDENLLAHASGHLSLCCSRIANGDLNYFPISAVLEHGARYSSPGLNNQTASAHHLPVHVEFAHDDWACSPRTASDDFDIIVAFSVIKWIHLEHLDDGLEIFFAKCAESLGPNGYLALEIQPWKSYESAVKPKKSPQYAGNLKQLRFKPEDFSELLEKHGLALAFTSTELPRQISLYRKVAG